MPTISGLISTRRYTLPHCEHEPPYRQWRNLLVISSSYPYFKAHPAPVVSALVGCSVAGAQAFARIGGHLSTLRKQGLPLLSSLQAALAGHPVFPSL
jgi:hypothetical protein